MALSGTALRRDVGRVGGFLLPSGGRRQDSLRYRFPRGCHSPQWRKVGGPGSGESTDSAGPLDSDPRGRE